MSAGEEERSRSSSAGCARMSPSTDAPGSQTCVRTAACAGPRYVCVCVCVCVCVYCITPKLNNRPNRRE
jgi:hypothetical protein